jgi:NAD(P)-dependent dehydrogenase (short-subunit alcohol dehydrogenase family)
VSGAHAVDTRPGFAAMLVNGAKREPQAGGGAGRTTPPAEAVDIAAAVRFLCSPGASYINGQNILVNGGTFLG